MKNVVGGELVGRVIREAMAAGGLDRHAVVERLGVSARKRSEWFQVLDRLRAGNGASTPLLERIAAALQLDPGLVQAAIADDAGDDLDRYRQWEAWAWQPVIPDHVCEILLKGNGPRHPLPASLSREAAYAFGRELFRRTGHWILVPAFRSVVAHWSFGRGGESRIYISEGVPDFEAVQFGLRDRSLRRPPPPDW